MNRDAVERHQVWLYLLAILAGLGLGRVAPGSAGVFEWSVWPALSLLMYATFTQVPLAQLPAALRDVRFVAAALGGNFVAVPLLVWGVIQLAPPDPAIRLGLLLVLLVPCTDWFVTFAHQAGGDARRALAITPLLLAAQLLLLPLYVGLFLEDGVVAMLPLGRIAGVFLAVVALPLAAAWGTRRWAAGAATRQRHVAALGGAPVPLLALVLMLVAGAQVDVVVRSLPVLGAIAWACAAFLVGAAVLGLGIGRGLRLPVAQRRTLLFTLTTRNSFVVLPFALALPEAWAVAAIVIVFQSLLELFGMALLVWLVPRVLLPDDGPV